MSNEFRPLVDVLREIRMLAQKKESGFLFITTADNHSCIVKFNAGHIQDVVFRMLRNDEAIQRLTMVESAKTRFQAEPTSSQGKAHLSQDSLEWLLGGFEQDLSVATQAATHSGDLDASDIRVRKAIEGAALNHLGPIGGMLCDEAFGVTKQPQQIIDTLAGNLSTPQERQAFTAEVREALSKIS